MNTTRRTRTAQPAYVRGLPAEKWVNALAAGRSRRRAGTRMT